MKSVRLVFRGSLTQKCHEPFDEWLFLTGLALPDGHDLPTQAAQLGRFSLIAFHVGVQFGLPVLKPRLWGSTLWALMAMPKASMNEDRASAPDERKIGLTRNIPAVYPVAITERPSELAKL